MQNIFFLLWFVPQRKMAWQINVLTRPLLLDMGPSLKPPLSLVFYDREWGKETLVKRYRSVSSDLPSSSNPIHQQLMFQLQINWWKTELRRHDADQGRFFFFLSHTNSGDGLLLNKYTQRVCLMPRVMKAIDWDWPFHQNVLLGSFIESHPSLNLLLTKLNLKRGSSVGPFESPIPKTRGKHAEMFN